MTKSQKYNEIYFTTYDLGLAAALVASGYALDHLDRTKHHKVQFVFQRTYGVDETTQRFWAQKLQLEAQSYFNAIKLIKNRLYSD